MISRYFLNDSEMIPVAPVIAGITFVFTSHVRCISIVGSLYFKNFSASSLITFLSLEITILITLLFSLLRIMVCGLLLGMVLSRFIVYSIMWLLHFYAGWRMGRAIPFSLSLFSNGTALRLYFHDFFLLILIHPHTRVSF